LARQCSLTDLPSWFASITIYRHAKLIRHSLPPRRPCNGEHALPVQFFLLWLWQYSAFSRTIHEHELINHFKPTSLPECKRKLPTIIKRDKRYKDGHPHEAVETEAISQKVLIDILRARLRALLPEPLARVLEREKRQRREIARLLRR
jgi:hypothetical protein